MNTKPAAKNPAHNSLSPLTERGTKGSEVVPVKKQQNESPGELAPQETKNEYLKLFSYGDYS